MTKPRDARGWAGIALVSLLVTNASVAAAAPMRWAHYPPGCPVSQPGLHVACGDLGAFVLGVSGTAATCASTSAETVKFYHQPKAYQSLPIDGPPLEIPGDWQMSAVVAKTVAGNAPFAGSARPVQAPAPDEVWAALIDWPTWHGMSIAWILRDLAPGTRLLFLDLESPALDVLGDGVSDAHLLTHLCTVRDLIDRGVAPPPRLINLSLGRYAAQADLRDGAACNPSRLGCRIIQIIESFAGDGVVVATAAGNHRSLLFPAVVDAAVAIGALDLAAFEQLHEVRPAWESPSHVDGWFPADNLCLRGGWFAPAGTSFASAVFSGWLLATLEDDPTLNPTSIGTWNPTTLADGCLVLAGDGVPLHGCKTAVSVFMEHVFAPGSVASPCYNEPAQDVVTMTVSTPVGPVPLPRFDSFDRWVSGGHQPTPETDFCVPCMGGGGGGGGASTAPVSKNAGDIPATPRTTDLVLNLASSPATNGYLDTIYLRVGHAFHRLNLDAESLQALTDGQVDRLVIEDARLLIPDGQQASLVPIVRTESDMRCDAVADGTYTGTGRCYWSASPLFVDDE